LYHGGKFTGQLSSDNIQKSTAVAFTIYRLLTSTSRLENYFLSVLTGPSTVVKLRKAVISFFMSVRLSACKTHTCAHDV